MTDRLESQIAFILEIDKLKSVYRRTYLLTGERNENSAEHSWHVALMVNILAEYADEQIDSVKVTKMLLIHDIVEVDSGDTFAYDVAGMSTKLAKEKAAADRIFGLLPADQGSEFRRLWDEFEECKTDNAKFAGVLDRLMPEMHNAYSPRSAWKEHHVTLDQVIERNRHIEKYSPRLWEFTEGFIKEAYRDN